MSIESVLNTTYQGFLNLFTNLVFAILTPIVNLIYFVFPNLNDYIPLISDFFDIITKYILYIVDLSMIHPFVWAFLIGSIIYRITYSYLLSTIKIVVKWWEKIVP